MKASRLELARTRAKELNMAVYKCKKPEVEPDEDSDIIEPETPPSS